MDFENKKVLPDREKGNANLYARVFPGPGGKRPLVIVHGLLGSSRNWTTVAKRLGEDRDVYAIDLPDHGDSSWTERPSYPTYVERVVSWARGKDLGRADWLGHSLGGKVCLRLAMDHPECVGRLVLADIFPKTYALHYSAALRAMNEVPVASLESRKEAEAYLTDNAPDWAFRQFLLTNLVKDAGQGGFRWQVNLPGLIDALGDLSKSPLREGEIISQPSLLIHGGRSDFVNADDLARLNLYFSDCREHNLPNAGHNVHIEGGDEFVRVVRQFLSESA